jgi:hypothetical protein
MANQNIFTAFYVITRYDNLVKIALEILAAGSERKKRLSPVETPPRRYRSNALF